MYEMDQRTKKLSQPLFMFKLWPSSLITYLGSHIETSHFHISITLQKVKLI